MKVIHPKTIIVYGDLKISQLHYLDDRHILYPMFIILICHLFFYIAENSTSDEV